MWQSRRPRPGGAGLGVRVVDLYSRQLLNSPLGHPTKPFLVRRERGQEEKKASGPDGPAPISWPSHPYKCWAPRAQQFPRAPPHSVLSHSWALILMPDTHPCCIDRKTGPVKRRELDQGYTAGENLDSGLEPQDLRAPPRCGAGPLAPLSWHRMCPWYW